MKLKMVFAALLLSCASCFAWTCPKGQHWEQVPSGTPGATIVEGIPFVCHSDTPPTTNPSNTNNNTNTNTNTATSSSTSTATSNAVQSQGQKQQQQQTQTATGGAASANASNGPQSNAQTSNYSSSYTEVRQTPMAYAPEAFSSAPCRAGFSAGGSSGVAAFSLGGSKRDKDCEIIRAVGVFLSMGNPTAAAKVACKTAGAKAAKLTLAECLTLVVPPAPVIPQNIHPAPQAITVTVNLPPVQPLPPPPAPVKVVRHYTKKPAPKPLCPPQEHEK